MDSVFSRLPSFIISLAQVRGLPKPGGICIYRNTTRHGHALQLGMSSVSSLTRALPSYTSKRRPSRASRYSTNLSKSPGMSEACTSIKLGVRPCFSRKLSLHGLSWRRRRMYLRKCSASRTRRRELRPRRHGNIS